jgi:multidrug efflux pump
VYVPVATGPGATTQAGLAPVSATGQSGDAATGSAVSTTARTTARTPARTTARTTAPLSTIAQWKTGSTAVQVNHQDGQPAATISFNLTDGVSLGDTSARIVAAKAAAGLLATVHGNFAGTAQVFKAKMSSLPLLIFSALVVIYLVLGVLYESAIHPLTVLSTIPSAGIGAVIAPMVTGSQLDLIGIILLIGIVKKNAILIIDFALRYQPPTAGAMPAAFKEAPGWRVAMPADDVSRGPMVAGVRRPGAGCAGGAGARRQPDTRRRQGQL